MYRGNQGNMLPCVGVVWVQGNHSRSRGHVRRRTLAALPSAKPQSMQWCYLDLHLPHGWHNSKKPHVSCSGPRRGTGFSMPQCYRSHHPGPNPPAPHPPSALPQPLCCLAGASLGMPAGFSTCSTAQPFPPALHTRWVSQHALWHICNTLCWHSSNCAKIIKGLCCSLNKHGVWS